MGIYIHFSVATVTSTAVVTSKCQEIVGMSDGKGSTSQNLMAFLCV